MDLSKLTMKERLMTPKEFVDVNLFLTGKGLLKPDTAYYPEDTYIAGIDPVGDSNSTVAYCIFNQTKDLIVECKSFRDGTSFKTELEKTLKYYNIPKENQFSQE